MNVIIKRYNKNFEITLNRITQILGYNFKIKQYIIDSFVKHFSMYKYQDYDSFMEENVLIDNNIPGRKEYKVLYIYNRESLIEYIKWQKNSLLYEFVKKTIETLYCQKQLNEIDEKLTIIYEDINNKLEQNIENINLDYTMEDLFSIVSKSEVLTSKGEDIETMSNLMLFKTLYNLINENRKNKCEKYIVLVSDIDHLCNRNEYKQLIEKIEELDIYSIFFISMNNYVYLSKESLNAITVFNDNIFQVPNYDILYEYITMHYPVHKEFLEKEIFDLLTKVLNNIGIENEEVSYREMLLKKMINKAICNNDYYDFSMSDCEKTCLNDKKMV